MEAHSGQIYFINVMMCLSNFKVFAVIFTLRAYNYIILHIISFMLCLFIFMVPLINCMIYLFHVVILLILRCCISSKVYIIYSLLINFVCLYLFLADPMMHHIDLSSQNLDCSRMNLAFCSGWGDAERLFPLLQRSPFRKHF